MSSQKEPSNKFGLRVENEPMKVNDLGDAYYKESVQILGLSHGELADFINPVSSAKKSQ